MPTTHVTSLELSRRLKELKVPQESLFWWSVPIAQTVPEPDFSALEQCKPEVFWGKVNWGKYFEPISAYLASELGDMIYKNHKLMVCPNWEERGVYRMQYDLQWWCEGKTLADVYAKMLIYLIKNHLISIEELGK